MRRTQATAKALFGPRPPKVPAMVTAPPPIQPTSFISQKPSISHPVKLKSTTNDNSKPVHGCPLAIQLLDSFQKRIDALPKGIKDAGIDHPLAGFSGNPTGCVESGEDAWEKWDGPLNTLLQKTPDELDSLVVVGERGLGGLHRFLLYLVSEHGIQGALLEGKMERLFSVINRV